MQVFDIDILEVNHYLCDITLIPVLAIDYCINQTRKTLAKRTWCVHLKLTLQAAMDPALTTKRKALITDAARSLDKAKMMRFDEKSGNLYVTDLGRVASHFYIQYTSVETYNEMLKRHMNEAEVTGTPSIIASADLYLTLPSLLAALEAMVKHECSFP